MGQKNRQCCFLCLSLTLLIKTGCLKLSVMCRDRNGHLELQGMALVRGLLVLLLFPLSIPFLCSPRSFFQPKKEGKAKKPERETSNSIRDAESPPKCVSLFLHQSGLCYSCFKPTSKCVGPLKGILTPVSRKSKVGPVSGTAGSRASELSKRVSQARCWGEQPGASRMHQSHHSTLWVSIYHVTIPSCREG